MIYCRLKGNLGNILFQVAATLAIAKDNNTTASFPNLTMLLNQINADQVHTPDLKHANEYMFLFETLDTTPPSSELPIIKFPFHFENKKITQNCWIDGFFQSEKYFKHHKEMILKQFSPNKQVLDFLKKFDHVLSNKTASIHIRRGDYLKFYHIHPVLPISYYHKALQNIPPYDKCLVFSDDIEWCKLNFKGKKFIFIEEKDYFELFLMSRCNYNIIANSSFSWWAAWINSQADKVVVANKILVTDLANINTKDRNAEDWIVL